jgi:acetyl/propionyl-CoA carboxylase alpha subunit
VHAPTRDLAIKKMQYVLRETVISGVGSNLNYLSAISTNGAVVEGKVSTLFLDRNFKEFHPNVTLDAIAIADDFEKSDAFHGTGSGGSSQGAVTPGSGDSAALWGSVKL